MMNAISTLPADVKSKVVGTVLFGYTKNGQTKGSIPDYPQSRLKVFCDKEDGVCWGKLNVSAGHFAYVRDKSGPEAINFLVGQINGGGRGSSF
jgi:cutinase